MISSLGRTAKHYRILILIPGINKRRWWQLSSRNRGLESLPAALNEHHQHHPVFRSPLTFNNVLGIPTAEVHASGLRRPRKSNDPHCSRLGRGYPDKRNGQHYPWPYFGRSNAWFADGADIELPRLIWSMLLAHPLQEVYLMNALSETMIDVGMESIGFLIRCFHLLLVRLRPKLDLGRRPSVCRRSKVSQSCDRCQKYEVNSDF